MKPKELALMCLGCMACFDIKFIIVIYRSLSMPFS
ncbi:hypothetical protein SLEP1_g3779 [Rubroshorea leprosula]|uniref:NADH dehydrogenase subunit 1 n=1 Tax=Rubroshorea leprosula TaxID=152421 RepID=A0AAV5HU66_9ROSI|nr:hypothetical protein SLEP1_g3779 [Rubroshorea leprosula]